MDRFSGAIRGDAARTSGAVGRRLRRDDGACRGAQRPYDINVYAGEPEARPPGAPTIYGKWRGRGEPVWAPSSGVVLTMSEDRVPIKHLWDCLDQRKGHSCKARSTC